MNEIPTAPPGAFADVDDFLARLDQIPARKRARAAQTAPVGRVQSAALAHPDPFARRRCLDFLDHYASDESAAVFASALTDPVEPVRHIALHSVTCERCRVGRLCAADVVPQLVSVLANDPSVEMRHKAIPALLELADRDDRARAAVEQAARHDHDELIRDVAGRALRGEHVRARKTYERSRRRDLPTQ